MRKRDGSEIINSFKQQEFIQLLTIVRMNVQKVITNNLFTFQSIISIDQFTILSSGGAASSSSQTGHSQAWGSTSMAASSTRQL